MQSSRHVWVQLHLMRLFHLFPSILTPLVFTMRPNILLFLGFLFFSQFYFFKRGGKELISQESLYID